MTMKFKTTKKKMNNNFDTIISVGYENAQYLLIYRRPIAYSTRAEGWACDYYDIDNVLISTGYAPISPKKSKINYDMLKKYEDRAREIACDWSLEWENKAKLIEVLLKEFIREATGREIKVPEVTREKLLVDRGRIQIELLDFNNAHEEAFFRLTDQFGDIATQSYGVMTLEELKELRGMIDSRIIAIEDHAEEMETAKLVKERLAKDKEVREVKEGELNE